MKIALYSSTMGGGKSTVAAYLMEHHDFYRIKLAQVLKDMLVVFLANYVPDPIAYIEGAKKELPIPGLGVTGRYLMQTLGTDWGRLLVNRDIWLNIVVNRIEQLPTTTSIVIDDMRFENEMQGLVEHGFITIKLVGHGELTSAHDSEGGLDQAAFDYTVYNDGSIVDLWRKIDQIIIASRIR